MIPSVYGAPVGAPTSFRRVASASTANAKGGSAFRLPALSRSIRKTPAETGVTLTFPEPPTGPLQLGQAEFDLERGELRDAKGPIRLTGGEAALLAALAARPHEVLSREELAASLSMDESGERAIDVQVTRLRRKIEADPREPRFLHTVRGRGYVLKPGV